VRVGKAVEFALVAASLAGLIAGVSSSGAAGPTAVKGSYDD